MTRLRLILMIIIFINIIRRFWYYFYKSCKYMVEKPTWSKFILIGVAVITLHPIFKIFYKDRRQLVANYENNYTVLNVFV